MARVVRGDVEILVHITAPSRGLDDARYRALAEAYLQFEPAGHTKLDKDDIEGNGGNAESQLQNELLHSTHGERSSEASYRPEDESESVPTSNISTQHLYMNRLHDLGGLDSPILSFNSVMDNVDSPAFQNYTTHREELPQSAEHQSLIRQSQDSWKTPPSTVADSQPEPDRHAATSSPSRVWEVFLKQVENSEMPSPSSSKKNKGKGPISSPELPYECLEIPSSNSPVLTSDASSMSHQPSLPPPTRDMPAAYEPALPNYLDNIQPTQDPASTLKRKRADVSEVEPQTSSSAPSTISAIKSSLTSSSLGQNPKRQRVEVDPYEGTQSRATTSSKATEVATSSPAIAISVWAEKFEIRPPPPRTSTRDLTVDKLITQSLHNLATKMHGLYKPQDQNRELRPMERGHWLLDCQSWDTKLRGRMWNAIGKYVGESYAGWGVWCVRDEKIERIKVYCWGVVVEHVFLLLWMASEGKIRKAGARWIGGDGQAVIIMPS